MPRGASVRSKRQQCEALHTTPRTRTWQPRRSRSEGAVFRVALISDLHGNAIALREVLRSIEARGDNQVLAWRRRDARRRSGRGHRHAASAPVSLHHGNHDDYLLDPELVDEHIGSPMILDAIDWCRDQLSSEQLEFVRGFEKGIDVPWLRVD